jgi:voltage-gated potassium channel
LWCKARSVVGAIVDRIVCAPTDLVGLKVSALLGWGTLSLWLGRGVSWIVQRVAEEDTANQAATIAHIEELRAEIRQLAKSGSLSLARPRNPP